MQLQPLLLDSGQRPHTTNGLHVQVGHRKPVKGSIRRFERLFARLRGVDATEAQLLQNARGNARNGDEIVDHKDRKGAVHFHRASQVCRCEENPGAFLHVLAGLAHEQPEPDCTQLEKLSLEELDRIFESLVPSH